MEFQAIVCCGKGSKLTPFSAVRPNGVTKAMLPIANKPMIHYSLDWCDQAPFHSVLVVTDLNSEKAIGDYVNNVYKRSRNEELSSPIEVIGLATEGTGAIIKQLFDQGILVKDFILLSCDFVTDFPPQIMINEYRNRDKNDIGMCVYGKDNVAINSSKMKKYFTLYSENSAGDENRLLNIYSHAQVKRSKSLVLPTQMIWRNANVKVSTILADSFMYFCSLKIMTKLIEESYTFDRVSCTKIMRDLARRSWKHSTVKETIKMFILPDECDYIRADNLPSYMEANRYIMQNDHYEIMQKIGAGLLPPIQAGKKDKASTIIGPESKIGENTKLDERTNVKKSFIGSDCQIGKRCRISGSIILNNVVLEDEVVLENCLIGNEVKVELKSKLLNCEVEHGAVIVKSSNLKGETIMHEELEQVGFEADEEFEEALYDEDDDEEDDDVDELEGDDLF